MQQSQVYLMSMSMAHGTDLDWTLLQFDVVLKSVFLYSGSYMSAHVLLNLLNELRKRDKM